MIAGSWFAGAARRGEDLIAAGLLMLAGPIDLDELDRSVRSGWERRRGSTVPYAGPTPKTPGPLRSWVTGQQAGLRSSLAGAPSLRKHELTARLHERRRLSRWGASVASSPVGRPHRRQLLFGFITEGVNLHHVVATPPGHPEPLVVCLM